MTKEKGRKDKNFFGAKFLGYRRYPEGGFFVVSCQTLPLEGCFSTVSDVTFDFACFS